MSNEIVKSNQSIFTEKGSFELAQRVAQVLSTSSLVPKDYHNNIQNTMIALEMANRIGASPLMVMQNLYIIHGKPSWSSTFIISAINSCGRFSALKFEKHGTGDALTCYAWANDIKSGERLESPKVTLAMAKAEGWIDKSGSKWKTMPELMIMYRAAAFFGRLYAPDILMGMHTEEETYDIVQEITPQQIGIIESLIETSGLEDRQRTQLLWDASHGMTFEQANLHIAYLKENQLNKIQSGLPYNAKDIKDEIQRKDV